MYDSNCGDDHNRILHSDSDIFLRLINTLKKQFAEDRLSSNLLEDHLLIKCVSCESIFANKKLRDAHTNTCFATFAALATSYGEPLTTSFNFNSLLLTERRHQHEKQIAKGYLN